MRLTEHTCQWHPDGVNACGEPATKFVLTDDDSIVADNGKIWLCDAHYQDPALPAFWDEGGMYYKF